MNLQILLSHSLFLQHLEKTLFENELFNLVKTCKLSREIKQLVLNKQNMKRIHKNSFMKNVNYFICFEFNTKYFERNINDRLCQSILYHPFSSETKYYLFGIGRNPMLYPDYVKNITQYKFYVDLHSFFKTPDHTKIDNAFLNLLVSSKAGFANGTYKITMKVF